MRLCPYSKKDADEMKLHELSQLYYLEKLIRRDEQRLEDMRCRLTCIGPKLSGMPAKPGASDTIGDTVPQIVDLMRKIEDERSVLEKEKAELEGYLRGIQDRQLRLIFILRFVDLKSWSDVAERIGGGNTENSVKKMCYRHLKKSDDKRCPTCPADNL